MCRRAGLEDDADALPIGWLAFSQTAICMTEGSSRKLVCVFSDTLISRPLLPIRYSTSTLVQSIASRGESLPYLSLQNQMWPLCRSSFTPYVPRAHLPVCLKIPTTNSPYPNQFAISPPSMIPTAVVSSPRHSQADAAAWRQINQHAVSSRTGCLEQEVRRLQANMSRTTVLRTSDQRTWIHPTSASHSMP